MRSVLRLSMDKAFADNISPACVHGLANLKSALGTLAPEPNASASLKRQAGRPAPYGQEQSFATGSSHLPH
jgi:hypothetical protein